MGWNDVTAEGSKTEKIGYTKFEGGGTLIRVLDNEPYSFWSHWLDAQKTSVTCMGKDCPMCAVNAQLRANKEQQKYANSQRHAIRVYNYGTKEMEIMIQGKTFFSNLLTLHKEVGDITSYDIKVVRKGTGTDTTYQLLPQAPKEVEFDEGVIKDVDFAEQFKTPTRLEMIALMEGKTWNEINELDDDA